MESMRAFACPVCRGFAQFESRRCPNCLAELGLHVPGRTMVATPSGAAVIDGQAWIACTKAASLGCNWLCPRNRNWAVSGGHYKFGARANWGDSYISEYATMHPWEDFAECFAHYLHITGTIDTARESGLILHADRVRFSVLRDVVPLASYDNVPVERLLEDWKWLLLCFNRVNTAMGKNPLYPFDIPPAVVGKLASYTK
jgi:hypothetical protein